ncbi:MAG: penicillin-binding protein 2 [Gammaproteobacteria bacterium]|nr:penicillin-binding protein 2 [Gammaproteobacteria bacterium]
MQKRIAAFKWRGAFIFACFFVLSAGLAGRAFQLQVLEHEFFTDQADARHVRTVKISAHRGQITDRNGELIAVSTPVDSVWVNPKTILQSEVNYPALAKALSRDEAWVSRRISQNSHKEFVYLRRHMRPDLAEQIKAMNIPGLYLEREYQRYYPAGEVTSHLLGFTNIDDQGQEGLELAYDHRLQGEPGKKQVLRDRLGRSIDDLDLIAEPRPGETLVTSIDLRLQYLAYRELKTAVQKFSASSGSIVVLDVHSGEVLAMANQPAYNPNNRGDSPVSHYRNRAVTDLFEPGSSIKPLIAAAAIETNGYSQYSKVNTDPGFFKIGSRTIKDKHNLGEIDLTTVIARSSNVGIARVALQLEPKKMWNILSGFGLGQLTYSSFPGESAGLLNHYSNWRENSQASMAYGYGLSVTPLQMAQAYAVIGNNGVRYPISFLKRESSDLSYLGERIISSDTARQSIAMMEQVVNPGGTAPQARIEGYRVAGKTGTAWKFINGAYSQERYRGSFVGLAPATDPQVAVVVMIDDPRGEKYYGGDVAAPVFSNTLAGALRLLNVHPDGFPEYTDPHALQVTNRLSELLHNEESQ